VSVSPIRPLLIVVATVHLDSQWRWTIQQTIREFLPRTLAENFALFESHPRYELSFEGAFRYMLVREYFPEQFEELKRCVAAGRWHPVGGMLDAPDVNIVSPESLIRHILYGNGFFARELGRPSQDLFLPDCFGFGRALPSVAAHCGLESFSTSKLIKWKTPDVLPFEIARWRGPDGGEIVAAIQPGGYGEGIEEDLAHSAEWRERLGETAAVRLGIRYVGTGDRGGSPDRASLDRLEEMLDGEGPIRIATGPSDALASALTPEELERLPVWEDELLLPTHGTGCWTAQAGLKRWNRRNELLGDSAERAALMADWLGAIDYPRQRLTGAWIRFLWHQMHDDLTGTSLPAAYEFTWNDQAVAANLFAGVLSDSVDAVARELDTEVAGTPLVVFNPSGHRREDIVEAFLEAGEAPAGRLEVRDADGRTVPSQVEELGDGRRRLLFLAPVEPVSLTVFDLSAGTEPGDPDLDSAAPRATDSGLENHRYRVEIDASGDISSLFDKRLDRELLAGPIRFEFLRNRSKRWPAWEIRPETILERHHATCLGGPASVRVVESGPARAAVEIRRSGRGSEFRHHVRLAAGVAGDRLEIETTVDWATRGRLLKASFTLTAANPEATYDLGVGTIRRGNNRPERYEVPAQQWAGITASDGTFGVAVLNDCKYGWDKPADNELRLSLIHSPSSLRKYPHQRTQDHGEHRFTLAICGHRGSGDQAVVSRRAESLNRPLEAFVTAASPGRLGRRVSLLQVSDPGVAVRALKKAEDGDAWIVRLQEIGGQGVDGVHLGAQSPLLEANETNGCEEAIGPLTVEDGTAVTDLVAAGLKTLAVLPGPPRESIGRTRQRPLELPWNLRASSSHGSTKPVDFDGRGRSLPGELLPQRLKMGGVEFLLGPGDGANALSCEGQEIELTAGYQRLWILAASATRALDVSLSIDDSEHSLRVAPWTGRISERQRARRWLGLAPERPGYLTRDDLAWVGTHRHCLAPGGGIEDEPYVFCYLFRYAIDLTATASRLRLPTNAALRIFAATLTDHGARRTRPTRPLYG